MTVGVLTLVTWEVLLAGLCGIPRAPHPGGSPLV